MSCLEQKTCESRELRTAVRPATWKRGGKKVAEPAPPNPTSLGQRQAWLKARRRKQTGRAGRRKVEKISSGMAVGERDVDWKRKEGLVAEGGREKALINRHILATSNLTHSHLKLCHVAVTLLLPEARPYMMGRSCMPGMTTPPAQMASGQPLRPAFISIPRRRESSLHATSSIPHHGLHSSARGKPRSTPRSPTLRHTTTMRLCAVGHVCLRNWQW